MDKQSNGDQATTESVEPATQESDAQEGQPDGEGGGGENQEADSQDDPDDPTHA